MPAIFTSSGWSDLVRECLYVLARRDRKRRGWAIRALHRLGELAEIQLLPEDLGVYAPSQFSSTLTYKELLKSASTVGVVLSPDGEWWRPMIDAAIRLFESNSDGRGWGLEVLYRLGQLEDFYLNWEILDGARDNEYSAWTALREATEGCKSLKS